MPLAFWESGSEYDFLKITQSSASCRRSPRCCFCGRSGRRGAARRRVASSICLPKRAVPKAHPPLVAARSALTKPLSSAPAKQRAVCALTRLRTAAERPLNRVIADQGVSPSIVVRAKARPAIITRMPGHAGAHRLQFNMAR
jgi:hypothetical protein